MSNLLELCIDEFSHSNVRSYMEQKLSFEELQTITRFFFKWKNVTSDELWKIYNSENQRLITDIPLIKQFLKDCQDDTGVERLIRSLSYF